MNLSWCEAWFKATSLQYPRHVGEFFAFDVLNSLVYRIFKAYRANACHRPLRNTTVQTIPKGGKGVFSQPANLLSKGSTTCNRASKLIGYPFCLALAPHWMLTLGPKNSPFSEPRAKTAEKRLYPSHENCL